MAIEIDTDVTISFAHSQYDTTHIPIIDQTGPYVTPAAKLHGISAARP